MTINSMGIQGFIHWQYIARDTLLIDGEGFQINIKADARLPECLMEIKGIFADMLALENRTLSQDFDLPGAIQSIENNSQ